MRDRQEICVDDISKISATYAMCVKQRPRYIIYRWGDPREERGGFTP
jgi:hypothetical protein